MCNAAWAQDPTIGATNKGWGDEGSYTDGYTIQSNKTLTLTFTLTEYSGDWGGYVFSLTNNAVSAPQIGGNNGYVWFRSPDFAWNKSDWNTGAIVSNTNTKGSLSQPEWQAFVKGATTVMAIQRYGTQVFIKTTVTKEATSYTHYFVTEIGTTEDVKAFLCADAAVITISNAATTDTGNVDAATATIGAVENTGDFVASPVTTLEPESVLTMQFTNHNNVAPTVENFRNWGIELQYSESGEKYFDFRAGDQYCWGLLYGDESAGVWTKNAVTAQLDKSSNWPDDVKTAMNEAEVILTIERCGRVVTIKALHTPTSGDPFWFKYTLEPREADGYNNFGTSPITVKLITDHSHITYKFPIGKISTTIASSGYSTLASTYGLDFSSVDGLTAYVVTDITNTTVKLTSVDELPANSGVILKGTANATYTIPVKSNASYAGTNNLHAAVTGYNCSANKVYIMQGGQFHLVTAASTVPAGKAYLKDTDVPNAARSLDFFFDDETMGVTSIEKGQWTIDNAWYNLNGQKVLNPSKGLYIVNGKKVVIK